MGSEDKYSGMTVNERLYVSGLMEKYEAAVSQKDIEATIAILKIVGLGKENINAILLLEDLINDKSGG